MRPRDLVNILLPDGSRAKRTVKEPLSTRGLKPLSAEFLQALCAVNFWSVGREILNLLPREMTILALGLEGVESFEN